MSYPFSDFFMPRYPYRGKVNPENLVFDANLQEFAQRVSHISNLELSGKISPQDSYAQIRSLWKELKRSKKMLRVGENPFNPDNLDSDSQAN
jgi:hypothetical protein